MSLVREYVPQIVPIDLEKLHTWREYEIAVGHSDRRPISWRFESMTKQPGFGFDELIALMTIAWTMDYGTITKRFADKYQIGFMTGLNICRDETRQIVAGALLQRD